MDENTPEEPKEINHTMEETIQEVKDGYTRVSAIASAFAGYGSVPKHVLDRAAARGGCVHRLIFDHMNDIAISSDRWDFMGTPLNGYFDSFLKFWKQYEDAEILMQEQRLNDDSEKLTGEPDLFIRHNKKRILLDWKCAYKAGKHWHLQGSGYQHLIQLRQIPADVIIFVRLDKDGKDPESVEVKPDIEKFMWASRLYKEYFKDMQCNLENE